jgi:hypothetical protein
MIVLALTGSATAYVSFDGGNSWALRSFPSPISADASIRIIDNQVIVQNMGYLLISKDCITWSNSKVNNNVNNLAQRWNQNITNQGYISKNKICYSPGVANTQSHYLEAEAALTTVPFLPSSTPNTKWVVKAK